MTMDVSGVGSMPAPHAISGASGSRTAPPQQKMTSLFDSIDTGHAGTIDRNQFAKAFSELKPPASFQAAGETAVWQALDKDDKGSVTKADFVDGMKKLMVDLRQPTDNIGSDPGLQVETARSGTDAVNSFYI